MPKMRGTGKDPLGRYGKDLIFDLEDNDPVMVADFEAKGWATVLPEEEHPGRTRTQIAAAMVRGDGLVDPVEQKIAEDIGDDAHSIVHLDDPNATEADYDKEVAEARASQSEFKGAIHAESLGGIVGGGRTKKAAAAPAKSSGDSGAKAS